MRIVLALLLLAGCSLGQTTTFKNAWQRTPVPPNNSGVSATDLAIRGQHFDSFIGAPRPIDEPKAHASSVGFSFEPLLQPEYPHLGPGQCVVVGRFASFQPVLSPSRRSLYTVIHIAVERTVMASPQQPSGATIDVLVPGGTLRLDDGKVLRYAVSPDESALQPHQRYVLMLTCHSRGRFCTLADSWLIRKGSVWPNTAADKVRLQQGTSRTAGNPLNLFLSALKEKQQE